MPFVRPMITATHSAIIDCENEKVAPELLKVAEGVTRCFIFAERTITLSLSYGLDTRPAIQSNAGHRRYAEPCSAKPVIGAVKGRKSEASGPSCWWCAVLNDCYEQCN